MTGNSLYCSEKKLLAFIAELAPKVAATEWFVSEVRSLSWRQRSAVFAVLRFERLGSSINWERYVFFNRLRSFNIAVNQILAAVLEEWSNGSGTTARQMIGRDEFYGEESAEVILKSLKTDGYVTLPNLLSDQKVEHCLAVIKQLSFRSKREDLTFSGEALLGSQGQPPGDWSAQGTYWVNDMDALARDETLRDIALSPSLINLVSRYLGSTPILAR